MDQRSIFFSFQHLNKGVNHFCRLFSDKQAIFSHS